MTGLIEGLTATHDLLHDFDDRIDPDRRERMAAEFPPPSSGTFPKANE